ncbi:CBS domain-containing protein [Brevundimonas sp. BAL450]|jgi:CBS domain-containing protein|uniref:CBS domain protein n=1 Tax=Brevundimonas abyssalis TAR-001 TaxID=1391729 RepID=A0A8E0NDV0_9CAUL|nr:MULTISPECIES: CBS domain-containing protein [Brevundimonas]MBG7614283.1 CBS domain-containing protein [Brevundimonas sp. BAL450]GAD60588.1 CBS domain protein [Brevundimonas abyssalis TAR-001]
MKVRDIMSRDVQVARPGDSIQNVAGRMAAGDFGFMPVAEGDQLVGTVTDRDLVVRALAGGAGVDTPVSEAMTTTVEWRRDDEDLKDVLKCMSDKQIRRLPILDQDNRLVGVVSLGDLSIRVKEKYAGEALEDISRPN